MNGGKVTMLEEYYDMSIVRELDDSAFLPEGSVRPSWIAGASRAAADSQAANHPLRFPKA